MFKVQNISFKKNYNNPLAQCLKISAKININIYIMENVICLFMYLLRIKSLNWQKKAREYHTCTIPSQQWQIHAKPYPDIHLNSLSQALWRTYRSPHLGLPVKTNHLSNLARRSPAVGEEWDIMDLSNERRQKLRKAVPTRPHSRCRRTMASKTLVLS